MRNTVEVVYKSERDAAARACVDTWPSTALSVTFIVTYAETPSNRVGWGGEGGWGGRKPNC